MSSRFTTVDYEATLDEAVRLGDCLPPDHLARFVVDSVMLERRSCRDVAVSYGVSKSWVAELVREQLLAIVREELPHSIAARVTEWEWPRIRVEVLVERESQKGIVIGKGGSVLKQVGIAVREQLPEGAYLELFVKVDKDWQRRPKALERLGY